MDVPNGHMYWTDDTGSMTSAVLRRANLDGSNLVVVVDHSGAGYSQGIDLDLTNEKLYWTGQVPEVEKIMRANLDGTGVETVVGSGLGRPRGVKVDAGNSMLYWTDYDLGTIERANLDGSNRQTILSGLSNPYGIALAFGVVPEPSSIALCGLAGVGMVVGAGYRKWRRRKAAK
jgi:hypothetical protein